MRRDGYKLSLWQDIEQKFIIDSVENEFYDVIIIGGGITGISTALELQSNGKKCLVLEAQSIGFGTTGGTSAHLNTVLDTPYRDLIVTHGLEKSRLIAESAKEAIKKISSLVSKYNIDCEFTECSGYIYAKDDTQAQELENIEKAIRSVDIEVKSVKNIPGNINFSKAIKFEGQAHFHPTKYLLGLLQAYINLGGHIKEHAKVISIKKNEANEIQVTLASGEIWSAQDTVQATHTPLGIQILNLRLAPYRSYIQIFALHQENSLAKDLVYDMEEPFHYLRPVLINNSFHLLVGGHDHKTADHENAQYNFIELEAFVRTEYSVGPKIYEWSSQYYESQDKLPFIGLSPNNKCDNEYVATGFGGNGMIFGTLSSMIISNLILEKKDKYEELYSPARKGPWSSIINLVSDNIDVIKHFVMDRFLFEKIESVLEIAKGEGKIIKFEDDKFAVYKDPFGKIFVLSPICKHAGCVVQWNNAEISWDCPCHGARYAPTGEVLNGPSVSNLEVCDLTDPDCS